MKHAKRGRGTRRGVHLYTVVALGLALSACGGGAGSSAGAAAAQGSQPQQSSVASDGSAPAQGSTAGQGTSSASRTTGPGLTGGGPPTASAGAVTVNWTPPTENVDGSALTNLAGYRIHYGTASGKYTQTISVANAGLATYVVSDLTPGKYYFAVAAVNSSGTESPLSSEVSTTVN